METVKSLLYQIIDQVVAQEESKSHALSPFAAESVATAVVSHTPAASAAHGLDALPVLKSLAAKRPDLRAITLREGSHSHFAFAQPALELVPNKLACVESVELKGRNHAKLSALMTDVQLNGAEIGHSYLVIDLYVVHFNSGSAMRVEMLVFDAATEKCLLQPISNIASGPSAIMSRKTPPLLSAKAVQAIEAAEKQFEVDCASHVGRHHKPSAASSISPSGVLAGEEPIAARLRTHDSADEETDPEAQPEKQKERTPQRKHPAQPRGMTKRAVEERINAAVSGAEARIKAQLKRDHHELMSALDRSNRDQPAKRPKVCAYLFIARTESIWFARVVTFR